MHKLSQETGVNGLDLAYTAKCTCGWMCTRAFQSLLDEAMDNHLKHYGKVAATTQVGGSHYKDMAIQPAHFAYVNKIGYHEACAIKYLCRHGKKNGKQDLEKAIHFIQMLIEEQYP